jgi:hypothetical protein
MAVYQAVASGPAAFFEAVENAIDLDVCAAYNQV